MIGEHGDSEVLTWSLVTLAGMPLESFTKLRGINLTEEKRREIDRQVRHAAYTIIGGKGATYYGIGSALARIVKVILHDQRAVMTSAFPRQKLLVLPTSLSPCLDLWAGLAFLRHFLCP